MSCRAWKSLDHVLIDAAELTSAALLVLDPAGRIAWHNQQLGRLLGYPVAALSGRSIGDVAPDLTSIDLSACAPRACRESGISTPTRVRFRRKDGGFVCHRVDLAITGTAAEPFTIVTIGAPAADDTTAEHEGRLARDSRLATSRFLTNTILHDFNNILAGIAGHARLAKEGADAEARAAMDEVLKASERGAQLIQRLRGTARETQSPTQGANWQSIAAEAVALLRGTAPTNVHIALTREGPQTVVDCTESEIHQIVMNLGLNALDALAQAGGTLSVTLRTERIEPNSRVPRRCGTEGDYACLIVSDDGCGMDAATRAAAFRPFFSTKPASAARGLGLAIVSEIVNRRRGFVELDSELGNGAEFRVYLPLLAT